jgi:hypothetical protein
MLLQDLGDEGLIAHIADNEGGLLRNGPAEAG